MTRPNRRVKAESKATSALASSRRVAVVGLETAGWAVVERLIERGFRGFVLADARPISSDDAAENPLLGRADVGRPRALVLGARLAERRPDLSLMAVPGPEGGEAWARGETLSPWGDSRGEETFPGCDVAVFAGHAGELATALRVNAACLEEGIALVPGLLAGTVARAGPLVVAGEEPCLRCCELRMRAAGGRAWPGPPGRPSYRLQKRLGEVLADEAAAFLGHADDPAIRGGILLVHAAGPLHPHPLLRTCRCPDCRRFGPFLPYRSALPPAFDEAPGRPITASAARLMDRLTGPIAQWRPIAAEEGMPSIPRFQVSLSDIGPPWGRGDVIPAGGCDLSPEAALAAALGEAVERSCVYCPDRSELIRARCRDVVPHAADPRRWDVFDPRTRQKPGFPYVEPRADTVLEWVWGYSLSQRRPLLLPAYRVFSFDRPEVPLGIYDVPILSGFATGDCLATACWRGLLEVLERDAFMITWANRLPVRRLRVDRTSAHGIGDCIAAFEDRGKTVRCVTVRLELGVDLVVAMARPRPARSRQPGDPALVIAMAADTSVAAACRRALEELVSNLGFVRYELGRHGHEGTPHLDEVSDMGQHGRLYADPEMARRLSPWWHAPATVEVDEPNARPAPERLQDLQATVEKAGLEVLMVDVTLPEYRSLDLRVVKVLVPGTYPINFDSRWPQLGGERLRAAPVRAGILARPVPFERLDRTPHPYP